MLKKINNKDIFKFKMIIEDNNFNKIELVSKRGIWTYGGEEIVDAVYFDYDENKRIYIKFDEDEFLTMYRIIRLEII